MSWRSVTQRLLVLPAVLCVTAALRGAEEPTSENNEQLKRARARYPDADADHDGVLTRTEAQAYIRTHPEVAPKKAAKEAAKADLPPPDVANASYGPHERNVLDLWKAKSDQPMPLAVFIHGGGFVGGDKRQLSANMLQEFLKQGVSVAAINYRFATTAPFPGPMKDSARAIQFLRSKAQEWNLDPQHVAAWGGSAGAGISMWLAFHDDLADPKSDDSVARQSTRLSCAGSQGGQSTYDPKVIKEWLGPNMREHPSLFPCYGVKEVSELETPEVRRLAEEVSAINHLTKDDPPVFMSYSEPDTPLPPDAKPGQGIHHPVFGKKLKEKMDDLKIENVLHLPGSGKGPAMVEFFLRYLKASPARGEQK